MIDYKPLSCKDTIIYAVNALEYMLNDDTWDTLANGESVYINGYEFLPECGLCGNALEVFQYTQDKYALFESWVHYSGRRSYPVPFEDYNERSYKKILYANPLRKDLAEHCLAMLNQWLAD